MSDGGELNFEALKRVPMVWFAEVRFLGEHCGFRARAESPKEAKTVDAHRYWSAAAVELLESNSQPPFRRIFLRT
jgi:hypothetical protein